MIPLSKCTQAVWLAENRRRLGMCLALIEGGRIAGAVKIRLVGKSIFINPAEPGAVDDLKRMIEGVEVSIRALGVKVDA